MRCRSLACPAKKDCCEKIEEARLGTHLVGAESHSGRASAARTMLLPRFSIRTFLIATAGFAVVFLIVGAAVRGGTWGWGVTIGIASLAVTALVHAAYFGVIY